jgi:2-C-methyl-D-erythritol 4-phosphate cytidylyltransferase
VSGFDALVFLGLTACHISRDSVATGIFGKPRDGSPRHVVLVPAAGTGVRMGARVPKQYLELCGRSVLECAVATFLEQAWFDHVAVVVQPGDEIAPRLEGLRHPRVELVPRGGLSRRDTVLNGLTWLAQRGVIDQNDWVYVHDAARPGLDAQSLLRLSSSLEHETCGALLCIPMTDTVKRLDPVSSLEASAEYRSGGTVDRSRLWLAQTPQVFRAGALRRALQAHPNVTDEAAAIELMGLKPKLVRGHADNVKITHPEDAALAAAILRGRQR